LNRRSSDTWQAYRQMAGEISALREDLQSARDERRGLAEGLGRLESALETLAAKVRADEAAAAAPAAPAKSSSAPVPASVLSSGQLKATIAAVLEEERKLRDEERQLQREELRNRFEERQKELAAFKEGPYEGYNFKVNSLAKALELTDAQKQAYFDLSKTYQQKLQEGRQQLAGAPGEGTEKTQESRAFGRGRGDRGQGRQLYENLQNEFTAEVQAILSPNQLETYGKLAQSALSFEYQGVVTVPGEEGSDFGRFTGRFQQGIQGAGRGRSQDARGR
jgi:chromosome segregation ATPase